MNCMEAQALSEDALDNSLTGSRKRALDLHLSRCDSCRAFFEREREEHRRWFQAMNEPAALRRLPDGYADNFVSEMGQRRATPPMRTEVKRVESLWRFPHPVPKRLIYVSLLFAVKAAGPACIL